MDPPARRRILFSFPARRSSDLELTIEVDRPLPSLGVSSTSPGSPQQGDQAASSARAPHWPAVRRRRIGPQKLSTYIQFIDLTRALGPQPAGRGDGPTGAAPNSFFFPCTTLFRSRAHHRGRPAAAELGGLVDITRFAAAR